jgi:hypothetical protein
MPAPAKRKNRFWRKCRIYFRRARITVWLVTLAILGALIYLNLIGLPDFVKRPIIAKLRERGMTLGAAIALVSRICGITGEIRLDGFSSRPASDCR